MIQAIVYDAVGTLLHVTPSVSEIYARVGQRFGSRLGPEDIANRFADAFDQQDQLDAVAGWRTSEARERERWRAIVAELLHDAANPDACFEALYAVFGAAECWSCDADAERVLQSVQKCGYRQAMASNFDVRLRKLISEMPIGCYFEQIVISSEAGWRKPAPEFFRHVCARLHLPASDILYVGDDRTNDHDAARQAGMYAVLFDPHCTHMDVANRIERIGDLPRWLPSTGG